MKSSHRTLALVTVGIAIGAAITFNVNEAAERNAAQMAIGPLPLDELKSFAEVFERIKSDYVEPVEDKKLLQEAIQGMLSGLDPHSAYLDAQAFKDMRVETEGQFGGLGIEVTMESGFVKVVSPIEDTPAARAGIKAGDIIIRLDDKAVKGMTLNDAVRTMRGKVGTDITLTVAREGAPKPLKITITRAIIKVQSVKQRILEPGFGYVRITQFQATTDKGLQDALRKLETENKAPLKGLVLDLRNNPGGVLNGAVAVSDAFLDKGVIVSTEGRLPDAKMAFNATPGDLANGAPIVVLVNGGSASASEIVSGALQDHKRAVIMGTKTFGKGSVQTIIPVSNGAAVKITTARYYTPNHRSIQALGIVPDIMVDEAKLQKNEVAGERLREADLLRHLEGEDGEADAPAADPMTAPGKPADDKGSSKGGKKSDKSGKDAAKEGAAPPATADDYQLQEALNLLKGISVFRVQGTGGGTTASAAGGRS